MEKEQNIEKTTKQEALPGKEKKKHHGKTSRNKGHNGERIYAKLFKELGYTFCKTSRQASRLLDDAGIDLAFIPYNVQLKTGFHKALNPVKLLKSMQEKIIEFFPPEDNVHTNPCIVIHRNQIGPGNKRVPNDDLVFMDGMTFNDIYKKNTEKEGYEMHTIQGLKRGWTYKSQLDEFSVGRKREMKILIHYWGKVNNMIYVMSFKDFTKLINK
jgi:hypothetical protein